MKRINQIIWTVILCCASWTAQAQSAEVREVLEKVSSYYEKLNTYEIAMTYSMYKGLTGEKITEQYEGTLSRKGALRNLNILGSEMISDGQKQLVVDHASKQMAYFDQGGNAQHENMLDLTYLLETFSHNQLRQEGKYLICELLPSSGAIQSPYGKIELYINSANYSIEKQVFYFANLIPFKNDDGLGSVSDYGRLIVSFEQKTLSANRIHDFDHYLSRSGSNLTVSSSYQQYQLINQAN